MSPYKLIALDMDGTSINREGVIAPTTRMWIQKAREAGVEVTFATGRHKNGLVTRTMEEMDFRVPVVTMNGGEVWTADGQLLARHVFSVADIQHLYDMANELGLSYWGGTVHQTMWNEPFPQTFEPDTWLKFGFYGLDERVIRHVWDELIQDGRYEVTNSSPLNVEVNPRGVNKAAGLQIVCDHLGILPEEVVAMGDSMNDAAMLQWAGLGIAMGNAQDAVKALADAVTETVDADGVGRAIERFVLTHSTKEDVR